MITEIVYILRSRRLYAMGPSDVRTKLRPLLMLTGLRLANRPVYLLALDLIVERPVLDLKTPFASRT